MPNSATRAGREDRANLYQEITDKIIAELEAGRVPWVQPWVQTAVTVAPLGIPKNVATGRRYSGINVIILWTAVIERGFSGQSWLIFRQALGLGGHVRKGEKGTTLVYADRFIPDDERRLNLATPRGRARSANPEDDAARAERMRLARHAQEALESKVFFPISLQPGQWAAKAVAAGGSGQGTPPAQPGEIGTGVSVARLHLDPERDPSDQQRKLDFLKPKQDDRAIYNPHSLQHLVSPYEVMAGTVISASLITGLNSDLPGLVVAQVTENVYDTVTGQVLLIPQDSRLVGSYDSVIAFGQSRALVVWRRIIMPNGTSVVINNLPATDAAGYAGLEDQVDFHTWQLLKGVALSTLLGVGMQATFGNAQSNLVQAIRQSTQESTNEAGQRIVEKNLNVQPTITVRPGWPLRVIVHKDIVLRPYRS